MRTAKNSEKKNSRGIPGAGLLNLYFRPIRIVWLDDSYKDGEVIFLDISKLREQYLFNFFF